MKPTISVLVTAYNRREFLLNALRSVNNQSFKDYEIIIVKTSMTRSSIISLKSTDLRKSLLMLNVTASKSQLHYHQPQEPSHQQSSTLTKKPRTETRVLNPISNYIALSLYWDFYAPYRFYCYLETCFFQGVS